MSLILDALKRAERERKLEKAPDLSAIYQEGHPSRRKYRPWFWAGGFLLAACVVLAVAFWPEEPAQNDIKDKTPKSHLAASVRAKGSPPKAPPPATRKTVQGSALPPSAPPAVNKPLKAREEAQIPEKTVPPSQEKAPQTPGPVEMTDKRMAEGESPKPENVSPREKLAAEPVKQVVAPSRAKEAPKAAVAAVPPEKPKVTYPFVHELPEDVQSALGPLEINVHMYSPNPKERRVFMNMKSYREGDTIGESGARLAEILPNGVVIDYGKGKAVLGVRHR